jgi:hypothetical protein
MELATSLFRCSASASSSFFFFVVVVDVDLVFGFVADVDFFAVFFA